MLFQKDTLDHLAHMLGWAQNQVNAGVAARLNGLSVRFGHAGN